MLSRVTVPLLVLLACASACPKEPGPTQPTSTAARPAEAEPTTVPEAPEAKAPNTDDAACVKACVERRQMQAITVEMIEKNCRADCAAGSFKP